MGAAGNIVRRFVERINAHDVDGLNELMSDDHLFIDAEGEAFYGAAAIMEGWRGYFAWMPDYTITVNILLERGNVVGVFGTAGGTYSVGGELYPSNRWQVSAAWQAVVKDGKIARWQVFCDTRGVYKIMERYQ